MQERTTEEREPEGPRKTWRVGPRIAACVVLAGVGSFLLPAVPILAGALLVVAAGIHVALPVLRPYVDTLLRVPVARARRVNAHVALVAGLGVLLVASGAGVATLRGRFWSEREQVSQEREAADQSADDLLARARELLADGDVGGAEFLLLRTQGSDTARREEIDELLARMRQSGDAAAILEILVALSGEDFAALEDGTAVPGALDLGEPALTYRAVELALPRLDEARRLRATR